MKCLYCGGKMVDSHNNDFFDFGDRFVITKNIPCHRCSQCGEVAYDLDVSMKLEEMMSAYKTDSEQVMITEF